MLIICGIKVIVEGKEQLKTDQYYIFAVNHSSFFDHPIGFKAIPGYFSVTPLKFVFDFPIIGFLIKQAGYLPMERTFDKDKIENTLNNVVKALKNESILIYPEGKFSRDGKLQPFRRGTAEIAQRSGVPVIPMVIVGSSSILPIPPFKPVGKGIWFFVYALFWLGNSAMGMNPKTVRVIFKPPLNFNPGETIEDFTARLRGNFTDLIEDGVK